MNGNDRRGQTARAEGLPPGGGEERRLRGASQSAGCFSERGSNPPAVHHFLTHSIYEDAGNHQIRSRFMQVNSDQFALNGERVIHMPTGSIFWLAGRILCCDPGMEMRGGHLKEIKEEAWRLISELFA